MLINYTLELALMRKFLIVSVYALAVTAVSFPVQATPLNCQYDPVYGPDEDIDGDGEIDPLSGPIIGFEMTCPGEENEEVQP